MEHPLRSIRRLVDEALREMSPLFDSLYAEKGRVSIPPECLLRALVLQTLYGIPSERKLCEHLEYNLLFRWFMGLRFSQGAWHPTSFTKNRDRTLVEAAASLKSFRPKDEGEDQDGGDTPTRGTGRNPTVDFHGERRSNKTHASRTDPEARLARKGRGKEAKLAYAGHIVVENRNGLIVDCTLTKATGTAEEDAALTLLTRERSRCKGGLTVGADKGYNTKNFVKKTRSLRITPHVAEKRKHNAIDQRTTGWEGYATSPVSYTHLT